MHSLNCKIKAELDAQDAIFSFYFPKQQKQENNKINVSNNGKTEKKKKQVKSNSITSGEAGLEAEKIPEITHSWWQCAQNLLSSYQKPAADATWLSL